MNLNERVDSRMDCTTMVRFNISKGVWKITKLLLDHNHEFVPPEKYVKCQMSK